MPIQVFSKKQITIGQEIANGSFSKVFTVTYTNRNGTEQAVALKAYTEEGIKIMIRPNLAR